MLQSLQTHLRDDLPRDPQPPTLRDRPRDRLRSKAAVRRAPRQDSHPSSAFAVARHRTAAGLEHLLQKDRLELLRGIRQPLAVTQ